MIIEISVAIAVLLFAILTVFLIQTLCAMRKTLERVDRLSSDVTEKLSRLDSTIETISNLGEISKLETDKLKVAYWRHQKESQRANNYSSDLAELLGAGIKLGSKLFLRRQSDE